MSNMQGKKGTATKRGRSWSDANKQGLKARYYLDNIPKGLKLKYGASPKNRVLAVRKSVYPIPDVLVTKLKTSWQHDIATSGGAGAFTGGAYYLNSMADPSSSVGAYQPRFFDQLMAIYRSYTVYGIKVKVKVLDPPSAAGRVLFYPSAENAISLTSAYSDANELGGMMLFDFSANTGSGNINGPMQMTRYYDVGEHFGRDQESIMDDQNFSASNSGNNPASLFYLYFAVQKLVAGSDITAKMEIQFTQYVALRGVYLPSSST